MLKRVGVLALLLCGGAAFLHPTAALAQDYRGGYGYAPQYRGEGRCYRDGDRHREHEWREHEWREERREHEWREERREHEWRERQRWENGRYAVPYGDPRAYYGYPY